MARPELEDRERRSARLNLRFTPDERRSLSAQARLAGLADSEYARRRLTDHHVMAVTDPVVFMRLIAELSRIGVNMNQIARAANSGRKLEGLLHGTLVDLRGVLENVAERLEEE